MFPELTPPHDAAGGPARPDAVTERLRVTIGLTPGGEPVRLDLKEAVDGGMGPHGLITGAGGAGLLRAVVLGLAAAHVPDSVSFVLLDAGTAVSGAEESEAGGPSASGPSASGSGEDPCGLGVSGWPRPAGGAVGAFGGLDRLPHTEVLLGASQAELFPRLIEVLEGELARRKRLLVAAGCSSHSQYLRSASARPPMPALVLICHAFSALFDMSPGLLDVIRRIGWLGRARGIHLILADTGVAEPGLHDLAGYLSYRIALPGPVPDSPATRSLPPGHGLLRTGTDEPLLFRPHPGADLPAGTVERLGTAPPASHKIWLPPLEKSPALDDLAGPVVTDPDHGPRFADRTLHGTLQVPIALLDKPREHRRDVIWLPVAGNVAVVGGPGSGKTTFLRTFIASLALSHTAPDVRVLIPGSVAYAAGEPTDYQRIPLVHGILGPCGGAPRDLYARLDAPHGDTILVIDGWAEFWAAEPGWHDLLREIARRGSARGVHLVATAGHWSDFDPLLTGRSGPGDADRPGPLVADPSAPHDAGGSASYLGDRFASRLELRLADPAESAISPAAAATVPPDRPGRGIVPAPAGALHFLTTRPELSTTPHAALLGSLATDHCAECGFTYASVSAADLPTRLRSAGSLFASALLATTDLRRRPSPGVWSPLEYTCHVRDMLQVQRERLALALTTDNPAFTPMGRDERPARDAYNTQDPHTVLTGLDQAAESLAAAFETLTPAGLARTGVYSWPHPATRTLLWVGRHTVHEIVHHLLDISRQP